MEIIFNTNQYIRKLIATTQMLGVPNSQANGLDPRFFGKDFYTSTLIFKEIGRISQSGKEKQMWSAFLDRNIEATKKLGEFANLISLAENLSIPLEGEGSGFFVGAKESLVKDFDDNEQGIGDWLRKIFGFELPGSIDIVLDRRHDKHTGGNSCKSDGILISLQLDGTDKSNVAILLHELLHSLIEKKAIIKRRGPENNYFEEALLDYFAPSGILDQRIGLVKSLDVEEHQKWQAKLRPYSAEYSTKLLPVIKEYYGICGETTIWQFLKEKGFAETR